jgi:hypothetical protein
VTSHPDRDHASTQILTYLDDADLDYHIAQAATLTTLADQSRIIGAAVLDRVAGASPRPASTPSAEPPLTPQPSTGCATTSPAGHP